ARRMARGVIIFPFYQSVTTPPAVRWALRKFPVVSVSMWSTECRGRSVRLEPFLFGHIDLDDAPLVNGEGYVAVFQAGQSLANAGDAFFQQALSVIRQGIFRLVHGSWFHFQ